MLVVTDIEKSVTFYNKVPIAGWFAHCAGAADQVVSSILDAIESRLCRGCAEDPLLYGNVQRMCRKCAASFLHKDLHKETALNLTI